MATAAASASSAQLQPRTAGEQIFVATKAGRRLPTQTSLTATPRRTCTAFVERSLSNLATEAIDLLQLHCPPPGGL